ncbi:hypothetical protein NPD8_3858 (plasmid) [Clostridium botulinum]|uniref:Uncharacterized protein n=1 Tax=Clostridium botulinum TaxID=1491 RepID=A0A1L7JMN3_CLOBO|nr:hypothetical protein NPD8_3858 [Clostridium botulinum]
MLKFIRTYMIKKCIHYLFTKTSCTYVEKLSIYNLNYI